VNQLAVAWFSMSVELNHQHCHFATCLHQNNKTTSCVVMCAWAATTAGRCGIDIRQMLQLGSVSVASRYSISLLSMTRVRPEEQSRTLFCDFIFASSYLFVDPKFSEDLPMAHDSRGETIEINGMQNAQLKALFRSICILTCSG